MSDVPRISEEEMAQAARAFSAGAVVPHVVLDQVRGFTDQEAGTTGYEVRFWHRRRGEPWSAYMLVERGAPPQAVVLALRTTATSIEEEFLSG